MAGLSAPGQGQSSDLVKNCRRSVRVCEVGADKSNRPDQTRGAIGWTTCTPSRRTSRPVSRSPSSIACSAMASCSTQPKPPDSSCFSPQIRTSAISRIEAALALCYDASARRLRIVPEDYAVASEPCKMEGSFRPIWLRGSSAWRDSETCSEHACIGLWTTAFAASRAGEAHRQAEAQTHLHGLRRTRSAARRRLICQASTHRTASSASAPRRARFSRSTRTTSPSTSCA